MLSSEPKKRDEERRTSGEGARWDQTHMRTYIHTIQEDGTRVRSPDVQQHAVSIPYIHDMISNRAQTIDPSNCSHAAGGWLLPAKNTPTDCSFSFRSRCATLGVSFRHWVRGVR